MLNQYNFKTNIFLKLRINEILNIQMKITKYKNIMNSMK